MAIVIDIGYSMGGVLAGIVSGVLSAADPAVQRGRVCLLGVLPWPVLRSACLGCWRRCLPWMRGGIMAAGAPAVVGSCFRSGLFPKCIAGFQVSRRGFPGADAPGVGPSTTETNKKSNFQKSREK